MDSEKIRLEILKSKEDISIIKMNFDKARETEQSKINTIKKKISILQSQLADSVENEIKNREPKA